LPIRSGGRDGPGPNQDEKKDISDLSLIQFQAQTEQKIEKLLKKNGISEQELNQEKLLEGTD